MQLDQPTQHPQLSCLLDKGSLKTQILQHMMSVTPKGLEFEIVP